MALRVLVFVGLVLGFIPAMAFAGQRPVVVELFTSQGCSSCPPANAFLNEISRARSDVLPLAFHVTYWDRLGWKDNSASVQARSVSDSAGFVCLSSVVVPISVALRSFLKVWGKATVTKLPA
jgi:hypothetical protein